MRDVAVRAHATFATTRPGVCPLPQASATAPLHWPLTTLSRAAVSPRIVSDIPTNSWLLKLCESIAVCIPRYPPYLGARGTFSECTSGTAAFRICPGNSGYLGMGARSAHTVWDARGSCARARACSGRVRMTGCALVRSARRRTPRQAPQPRRLHYVPEVYLGNQACDQRARRRRRTVRFL